MIGSHIAGTAAGTAGVVVHVHVLVSELGTVAVGLEAVAVAVAGGIADTQCLGSTRLGLNMTVQLVLGLGVALKGLSVTTARNWPVARPGNTRREAVWRRPRLVVAVEAGWSRTGHGFRGSMSSLMIVVVACRS